ncbi:structural protein, partial [Staphylococcus pseudintermedius]
MRYNENGRSKYSTIVPDDSKLKGERVDIKVNKGINELGNDVWNKVNKSQS